MILKVKAALELFGNYIFICLFQFLTNRLRIDPDEELELILGNNEGHDLFMDGKPVKQKGGHDSSEGFRVPEILHPQATLGQIHEILWHCHGNLVS